MLLGHSFPVCQRDYGMNDGKRKLPKFLLLPSPIRREKGRGRVGEKHNEERDRVGSRCEKDLM